VRLQEHPNGCGPTALSNALLAVDRDVPPEACATLCQSDHEGTDERGLKRAIKQMGLEPVRVDSWHALIGALAGGAPVVCSVAAEEPGDHWVAVVGQLGGDRILVVDSLDHDLVKTFRRVDWLATWRGPRGQYYGIALV
jgi:ABC-type bacteriocin/lantibiotic exporter with double-glycine peptidase domain